MPRERISITNFLRASEIFLQERDHYAPFETALLQAMMRRLAAKVDDANDPEDPEGDRRPRT